MPRLLTTEQVRNLIPVLIEQTEKTQTIMAKGKRLIEKVLLPENELESIEADLDDLYKLWEKFISLHGGVVLRPWVVEFNEGSGFLHWNHDDKYDLFFRGYSSAESDLILIEEN